LGPGKAQSLLQFISKNHPSKAIAGGSVENVMGALQFAERGQRRHEKNLEILGSPSD